MFKAFKKNDKYKSQSVVEVIIAITIFALVGASITVMVLGSFQGLTRGKEHTKAYAIAQEGIEAVRAVRDRDWESLSCSSCIALINGGEWVLNNGEEDNIDQYSRTINISEVYRDDNDNIVQMGDLDPYTKFVEVDVAWEVKPGISNIVEKNTYLTNWWYEGIMPSSCDVYCIDNGYLDGICRSNISQCSQNGEIYESAGDSYCSGQGSENNCCCVLDEVETCDSYCINQGYTSGLCRQNSRKCSQNGETYESAGDSYCSGRGGENNCCCSP